MEPTYKILSDYSPLIDKQLGAVLWEVDGNLDRIVKDIVKITKKYHYQVRNLAKHLKGRNKLETAYNDWHFIKHNIKYAFDHPYIEQLRTPARSWSERFTGVDCDDYSIFLASLLIEQGYAPTFHVVSFNSEPAKYSHIFVVLDGIILDDVWKNFNEYPPHINKTMKIQALGNIDNNISHIRGLGATEAASPVTRQLMDHQSRILKAMREGRGYRPQLRKELRKVRLGIMLNGTEEQEHVLEIMPHIDDISATGNFIFKKGAPIGEIEEYLNGISEDDITLQDELSGIDEEYGDLGALYGKRKEKRKAKRVVRKAKRQVKKVARKKKFRAKIKKLGKGIKKITKKIGKGLIRFNPATITMRNGVLLVMKLNIKQWAGKLAIGYMTEAEARAKKYNLDTWRKLVGAKYKLEEAFKKMGGKVDALKKAILKGGKKGLKGTEELGSLGMAPAVAAAAITAGLAFLGTVLGPLVNKIGKKDIAPTSDETPEEVFGEEAAAEDVETAAAELPTAEESGFADEGEYETAAAEVEQYDEQAEPETDDTETKEPEEVSQEEENPEELADESEVPADDTEEGVEGLSGISTKLLGHRRDLAQKIKTARLTAEGKAQAQKLINKINAALKLNNYIEQEVLVDLMPYIDDIKDDFTIIYKQGAPLNAIDQYLSGLIDDGVFDDDDDDLGKTDWSKVGEGAGTVVKSLFKSNPEKKAARKKKRAEKKAKKGKKKKKFDFDKLVDKDKEIFSKGKKEFEKIVKKKKPSSEIPFDDSENKSAPDDDSKKDNTVWYVVAGVGVLAIGAVLMGRK